MIKNNVWGSKLPKNVIYIIMLINGDSECRQICGSSRFVLSRNQRSKRPPDVVMHSQMNQVNSRSGSNAITIVASMWLKASSRQWRIHGREQTFYWLTSWRCLGWWNVCENQDGDSSWRGMSHRWLDQALCTRRPNRYRQADTQTYKETK